MYAQILLLCTTERISPYQTSHLQQHLVSVPQPPQALLCCWLLLLLRLMLLLADVVVGALDAMPLCMMLLGMLVLCVLRLL
jgi:hypothetical protein